MLIHPEVIMNTNRIELPEGYVYAEEISITQADLDELDVAVNGPFENALQKANWPSIERNTPSRCELRVGVRDLTYQQLVGIGHLTINNYVPSRIDIKRLDGDLGFFMVHPDHRNKGIGTAILLERMRIADELEANPLRIFGLEDTNTLRMKYASIGFSETPRGGLVRKIQR